MSRPRSNNPRLFMIRVRLSKEEEEAIRKRGALHSLSLSAYLREVALGHRPRTTADQEAVRRLVEANANLGRVGGLLRMALKEPGVDTAKVQAALDGIQTTRTRLCEEASALIRSFRRGDAP